MSVDAFIAHYWGKAQPRDGAAPPWHPLAYHGLDVAACGAVILEARPRLIANIARRTGLPADVGRNWFLFALALHDIGKFADCFQCKAPQHWHHRPSWSGRMPLVDHGHGGHGATLWHSIKPSTLPLFGARPALAVDGYAAFTIWLDAIFGHHGRPVEPQSLDNRMLDEARADATDYVRVCAGLFPPTLPQGAARPDETQIRKASWLIAGVAMLADWLGSNQEWWFRYEKPEQSLPDYWPIALEKARKALREAGLLPPGTAAVYTLSDALPDVSTPRPTALQVWAADDARLDSQSLVVIEDLTGAGKTEAGLIVAHRLMAVGAAEGLYWALPTMATADALYRRLARSYGNMFIDAANASLVLAHGSRDFNDIFKKSIRLHAPSSTPLANAKPANDEDVTATAACTRWLADDRRKTFLADVGVGTIDQAVLGILPSKHQAMRLAGLSRRVLVIDEIHSLDAYQNVLVEALLTFHAAFGGSAVLISATLTTDARQRLADAFAKGAGWSQRTVGEAHFPLATAIDSAGVRSTPVASERGSRRDLAVKRLDSAADAVDVLRQAHADGLGAVWIRNTVQDALDAYRDVTAALPDATVDLFHARFALGDRLEIEQRVLKSFGKPSEASDRRRIVIATQVVEQSLDCDWDIMISDLAPIDLLIQRAGRLHRHDHRPPRPAPVLYVVGPAPIPDAASKWYEAAFPRAAYVYPNHGQLWLTMKVLLDAGGLLPLRSQNPRRLLEQVYDGSLAIPKGLERPSGKAEGADMSARAVGRMNALDLAKGYVHHAGAWESDTRTPTRLGDPTRTLRLAKWDGHKLQPWRPIEDGDGRKAWRLSEVSVLAIRVADNAAQDAALRKAIAAEMATWPESYDPPLLVPLVAAGEDWVASVENSRKQPMQVKYSEQKGLRFET